MGPGLCVCGCSWSCILHRGCTLIGWETFNTTDTTFHPQQLNQNLECSLGFGVTLMHSPSTEPMIERDMPSSAQLSPTGQGSLEGYAFTSVIRRLELSK